MVATSSMIRLRLSGPGATAPVASISRRDRVEPLALMPQTFCALSTAAPSVMLPPTRMAGDALASTVASLPFGRVIAEASTRATQPPSRATQAKYESDVRASTTTLFGRPLAPALVPGFVTRVQKPAASDAK